MTRLRAVSLSEMVLSIALMLLVVLIVFQLYPSAVASVRASGQRVQANSLADSTLASYMQKPFSQLQVGPPVSLASSPGRGTVFQPSVEILPVNEPGVDPDRILAIRVRVTWQDRGVARELVREQWRTDVRR